MTITDTTADADYLRFCLETADALIEGNSAVGTEGALTALIDVTMRYYYNIKNALTSGDFRRNELKFYTDRNSASVRQFLNNKMARMDVDVDLPEYMVGTYESATGAVLGILRERQVSDDMLTMSKLMETFVPGTITPEDLSNIQSFTKSKLVPYTRNSILNRLSNQFGASAAVTALGSKGKRGNAKDVIGTHDQYVDLYNELIKVDDIYRTTIDIQQKVMPMVDKSTRAMITRVHAARGTVDSMKDDAKQIIYQCLRGYAEMIDGYGVLLQLLQTIEHNFVLCTSALVEANK